MKRKRPYSEGLVREHLFKSECDGYICRSLGSGHFEAWTADGSIHWLHDDRVKTWADQINLHPLEYGVGGYSAETTGQKPGSFTLNLLRCDTTKIVEPFKGNTIIEARDVVFRRRIPRNHAGAWARRLTGKPAFEEKP